MRYYSLVLGAALLAASLDVTRAQTMPADNVLVQTTLADNATVPEQVEKQQLQQEDGPLPEPVAAERVGAPEGSSWLTKMLYKIYTPPKQHAVESDGTPTSVNMQYPTEIYAAALAYFSLGMLLIVGPFAYSAGKPRAYRKANKART